MAQDAAKEIKIAQTKQLNDDFKKEVDKMAGGIGGDVARKLIPTNIEQYEKAFGGADADGDVSRGRKQLRSDLNNALQTQLAIENGSIDEAQKGLNEQEKRIKDLQKEVKEERAAARRGTTASKDQIKVKEQIRGEKSVKQMAKEIKGKVESRGEKSVKEMVKEIKVKVESRREKSVELQWCERSG